jgi:ABC-type Zn uptake system ZnuABC Zn-binding protein ZnuA
MKKSIVLLIAIIIVLVGMIFVNKNRSTIPQELENKVGATIFPIYDIAQEIAGDEFEVVLLLPVGASPHTFDPQPSLLKDLSGAQAVFSIGHGLDDWSTTLTESMGIPVVTVDHDIELRATEDVHEHDHEDEEEHAHDHYDNHDEHGYEEESPHEHEHDDHDNYEEEHDVHDGHNHGPIDPHYWLSIHNAKQIAKNIADELGQRDVEHADLYIHRAEAYVKELDALERELNEKIVGIPNNNIISLHDAWYYFTDEFNLNLAGTFEPSAAKEPTPQYLAELEEKVQAHNVSAIFAEPQLSTDSIEGFADDHNLTIVVIDPLGGIDGRNSYTELMRYNVEQIVSALTN